MIEQRSTITEMEDPIHTVRLIADILEGSNFTLDIDNQKATIAIILDKKLDTVVYRNLEKDRTFKDFLPSTYKKTLQKQKTEYESKLNDLQRQLYMMRETVDISTKAMSLAEEIKDFKQTVKRVKKGWKFWN